MRPFPPAREYGSWDVLPEMPDPSELDLSRPAVHDGVQRRDQLIHEWREYLTYPHGVWSAGNIAANPAQAEAWRNWLLRRAWEGINILNGNVRRWSQD